MPVILAFVRLGGRIRSSKPACAVPWTLPPKQNCLRHMHWWFVMVYWWPKLALSHWLFQACLIPPLTLVINRSFNTSRKCHQPGTHGSSGLISFRWSVLYLPLDPSVTYQDCSVCVYTYVCTPCTCVALMEPEEGIEFPGTVVKDYSEPSRGSWELNPGPV